MPLGMANLRPASTGLAVNIHVWKNIDRRARHGPRVKVYPGKPHEGGEAVVAIPGEDGEPAEVIDEGALSPRELRGVCSFVERNWVWLRLYWSDPDFDDTALRAHLVP